MSYYAYNPPNASCFSQNKFQNPSLRLWGLTSNTLISFPTTCLLFIPAWQHGSFLAHLLLKGSYPKYVHGFASLLPSGPCAKVPLSEVFTDHLRTEKHPPTPLSFSPNPALFSSLFFLSLDICICLCLAQLECKLHENKVWFCSLLSPRAIINDWCMTDVQILEVFCLFVSVWGRT